MPDTEPALDRRPAAFGLTLEGLERIVLAHGLPPYTARQIARWLYGRSAKSFEEMTDLSARARATLAAELRMGIRGAETVKESRDGTKKYLFPAAGRHVESAFIPDRRRGTLCLSVQVGCRWGCRFCMTGRQGLRGNLSAGEIVNQLRSLPERVTNIVYMGMGEPLDNLPEVLKSLEILGAPWGYALSPDRITVSTVGMLPAVQTLLEATDCHLAVSLHSPFEDERAALMPVQNVHPLAAVLDAIRAHRLSRRGFPGRRRVSFEYIMLKDVNDSPRHARELVRILQGIPCRVNLIRYHRLPGLELSPSPRERMVQMQERLKRSGIMTTVRVSRGEDIAAACGMLCTREAG